MTSNASESPRGARNEIRVNEGQQTAPGAQPIRPVRLSGAVPPPKPRPKAAE